jgi:hypothetical protein
MGTGTSQTKHNVVFIATENDSVYAFDADNNSAANASPLWHVSLVPAGARVMFSTDIHNYTDIVPVIGITSTPVIDPSTGTIYVVAKTKEGTQYVQRLHALNIANGAEKLGGPIRLAGSVPGNGNGSSSGTLRFDPYWQNQRAGLLLLHGVVYIASGAHQDFGTWHGWILAYATTPTLHQTGAWCSTPNGFEGGIWGAGTGLAADVPDPAGHPFGRIVTSTGNGKFDAVAPNYNNSMDYADSILKLDLTGGVPTMSAAGKTVGDDFTPNIEASLNNGDLDQGSGGTLVLPPAASNGQHLAVQVGKTGRIYVVNEDSMGGYHPANASDPQQKAKIAGVWSAPAYWNRHLYFWASGDNLRSFNFVNGVMSSTSTHSAEFSNFPGSTPTVSANGTSAGIVWDILSQNFASKGRAILQAHDALDVTKLLYSSEQDVARDNPGGAVKFTVPTVANGKVYVGTEAQLSVYGLLNGATQAAAPAISPASESFASSVTVTITDSTPKASIHYTTDGTTPTAASPLYSGPITVTNTVTIHAVAIATGYLDSSVSIATYTKNTQVAMPTFSPAPGTYSSAQQVTIASTTSGATIHYTTDSTTPTATSTKYTGPVAISVTTTLKAIAISGTTSSAVASGLYTIQSGPPTVAAPTFSPAPGTYSAAQQVTMTSTTSGATIYYTTNGTTPTATAGTKYSGPVAISATTTLKAIAISGTTSSAVTTGLYTIQSGPPTVAAPTFSPAPGHYPSAFYLSMSTTTSGATIYYTLNGTTPTAASPKYGGSIVIHASTTVKAIAIVNTTKSAVATGVYSIP